MLSLLVFRVLRCSLALVPLFLHNRCTPAVVVVRLPSCSCSAVSLARWSACLQFAALDYRFDWVACCCWDRRSLSVSKISDLGFLGRTCSRLLCWFPLVGSAFLIGVAVILSLLQAPFLSSMIEIFGLLRFLVSINFLAVRVGKFLVSQNLVAFTVELWWAFRYIVSLPSKTCKGSFG